MPFPLACPNPSPSSFLPRARRSCAQTARPMLNTDNGVLLMLIARLVHEPAALICEEAAVLHAYKRGYHEGYLEVYLPCFAKRLTKALLLHRLQKSSGGRLPWLRFLFPREGWQRSFEAAVEGKQHHPSLSSFQSRSDLFGHGWKSMCATPLLRKKPQNSFGRTTVFNPLC